MLSRKALGTLSSAGLAPRLAGPPNQRIQRIPSRAIIFNNP